MKKWEVLDSKMAFDHKWYKVRLDTVRLPSGKVMDDYYVSVRGEYVKVIPLLPNGNLIMVKQYKHGAQEILIEFPAGFMEGIESAENSAIRELREETGYIAEKYTRLGVEWESPTKSTSRMHIYLAEGLKKVGEQELDGEGEDEIQVIEVSEKTLLEMIVHGDITVGPTLAAALLYFEYKGKIQV